MLIKSSNFRPVVGCANTHNLRKKTNMVNADPISPSSPSASSSGLNDSPSNPPAVPPAKPLETKVEVPPVKPTITPTPNEPINPGSPPLRRPADHRDEDDKKEVKPTLNASSPANPSSPPPKKEFLSSPPPKPKKSRLKAIIGGLALFLLMIGGAVGIYLTQQSQDVRQKATWDGCTIPSHRCDGLLYQSCTTMADYDEPGQTVWQTDTTCDFKCESTGCVTAPTDGDGPTSCSRNVCENKRCVTESDLDLCANGTCGCYSNACNDGDHAACGGSSNPASTIAPIRTPTCSYEETEMGCGASTPVNPEKSCSTLKMTVYMQGNYDHCKDDWKCIEHEDCPIKLTPPSCSVKPIAPASIDNTAKGITAKQNPCGDVPLQETLCTNDDNLPTWKWSTPTGAMSSGGACVVTDTLVWDSSVKSWNSNSGNYSYTPTGNFGNDACHGVATRYVNKAGWGEVSRTSWIRKDTTPPERTSINKFTCVGEVSTNSSGELEFYGDVNLAWSGAKDVGCAGMHQSSPYTVVISDDPWFASKAEEKDTTIVSTIFSGKTYKLDSDGRLHARVTTKDALGNGVHSAGAICTPQNTTPPATNTPTPTPAVSSKPILLNDTYNVTAGNVPGGTAISFTNTNECQEAGYTPSLEVKDIFNNDSIDSELVKFQGVTLNTEHLNDTGILFSDGCESSYKHTGASTSISFTYEVVYTNGLSDTATVTFNFIPANSAPVCSNVSINDDSETGIVEVVQGEPVNISCNATNANRYVITIDGETTPIYDGSNSTISHTFDTLGDYDIKCTAYYISETEE